MPEGKEKADHSLNPDRLIEFRNVALKIGRHRLIHDISCSISASGTESGNVTSHALGKVVVMGPNGAGKSLFLRLLAGLVKPTGGKITRGAHFLQQDFNLSLSIVFQRPVLLRRSTRANVSYVLQHQNLSKIERSEKVSSALKVARLEEKSQIPARRLSGGEQQRLALARALVVKPKILLLDEVTASLDPASTQIVESMIDDAAGNGTKVVLITHDVRQAKRVADEILFIHQGRVLTHKSAKEFFRNPDSYEAQAYLDGRVPDPEYRN